jgi:hypothetical protein
VEREMSFLPRLTWIIVDGLPLWLLEHFSGASARLPTLSSLRRERRIAGLLPVSPNCQTPPSLFSLFSGTPPVVHGLSGFHIPDVTDPLAIRDGFHTFARHIPMIWDRYAAAGLAIRLCQIPYVELARLGGCLRSWSYGFGKSAAGEIVVPAPAAGRRHALDGVDREIVVERVGPDYVELSVEGADVARQGPVFIRAGVWAPLRLAGHLTTIVGFVTVDGIPSLIVLGAWRVRSHGDAVTDFPTAPFVGGGIGQLYRRGRLGRIAVDGGDGSAELAMLGAVRAIGRRFWAEALDAQARGDADLVIAYQPAYDLLFHEILGLIDRDLNRCSPEIARQAETLLLCALADVDAALAALSAVDGSGRLVVSSDHGMKTVDTILLPNVALKDLGFLVTHEDGSIDAFASVAFYHPAETGVVCFAPARLQPHGVSMDEVMDRLVDRLTRTSGRLCSWFSCYVPNAGPQGFVATHYLSPGRGQSAKASLADKAVEPSRKSADHATISADRQLVGVLADLSTTRVVGWPESIAAENVLPLLLETA